MKKILALLLLLSQNIIAQKVINVEFNTNDFDVTNKGDYVSVSSTLKDIRYVSDTLAPSFPYVPLRLWLPNGNDDTEYTFEAKTNLLYSNVRVRAFQLPQSRNKNVSTTRTATKSVNSPIYKVGVMKRGKVKYLYLKLTPFIYDSVTGNLSFVKSLSITLPNLPSGEINVLASNLSVSITKNSDVETTFVNKEEYERNTNEEDINNRFLAPTPPSPDILPITDGFTKIGVIDEYLIVTNSQLAAAFDSLKNWKESKCIPVKIATTDTILTNYSGSTPKEKIRNFIHNQYSNHGTKYVLLGGDETVIPVHYCCSGQFPTDLYYACFNQSLNWEGFLGVGDSIINMIPNVYLTRLPVRNSTDVINFSNKIKQYELGTNINNNILLAGDSFVGILSNGKSDAQQFSEMIYEESIYPYWDGEMYELFDTYFSLPENASYYISGDNLYQEIERGYHFILENSHGEKTHYCLNNDSIFDYYTSHAVSQTNFPGSVIVTGACDTNGFDKAEPCLSESLIRNPNGGAIAYFGTTRTGFGDSFHNGDPSQLTLMYSDAYNSLFFNNLFTDLPTDAPRAFGAVAAKAKSDLLEECQNHDEYEQLQYSINAMGDPEMQIFTDTPKIFGIDTPMPTLESVGSFYNIDTKTTGCKISVLFGRAKYVKENVSTTLMRPFVGKVAITKPNYVPYIFELNTSVGPCYSPYGISVSQSDRNTISVHVEAYENRTNDNYSIPEWNLTIRNVVTGEKMIEEDIKNKQSITIDTHLWPNGLYAIHAEMNGNIFSKKIMIK